MINQSQLRRRFYRRWQRQSAALAELANIPAARLGERLADMQLSPSVVLSVGGNGAWLQEQYPTAQLYATDFIADTIAATHQANKKDSHWHGICCDGMQLPFADDSVDIVGSAFFYEYADSETFIAELHRVLKPDGLLALINLGTDSLRELRQVCGSDARVHSFPDMHDVGDTIGRSGFAEPIVENDIFTLTYARARDALSDIKNLGIGCLLPNRPRGMLGKHRWQQLLSDYEAQHKNADGKTTLTFEVSYTTAWKRQPASGESPVHFHR